MRITTPNQIVAERGRLVITETEPKSSVMFRGWGPKLFGLALAAAALSGIHTGASASETGTQAASCISDARFPAPEDMPPPDYPTLARADFESGSVLIQFDVAPSGNVLGTWVARSSGYPLLDRAALLAAREVRFKAAGPDCQTPIQSFAYSYDFNE